MRKPRAKKIKREKQRRTYRCPRCGTTRIYWDSVYTVPCPNPDFCNGTMLEVEMA